MAGVGGGRRVLVTGGTGYLGYRVAAALLDLNIEVTLLLAPDDESKLGALRSRVRVAHGSVWEPGSLRGRARGHQAVIHLVGGLRPDPARGLTFRQLNLISARNTVQMAVNDGVWHVVLLSASAAPLGVSPEYIETKREAERHLQKAGVGWSIVRAAPIFVPGTGRHPLYRLLAALRWIPLVGLLLARWAPIPVDIAARGIAELAATGDAYHERMITPNHLRRLGRAAERRLLRTPAPPTPHDDPGIDEPPFGWLP